MRYNQPAWAGASIPPNSYSVTLFPPFPYFPSPPFPSLLSPTLPSSLPLAIPISLLSIFHKLLEQDAQLSQRDRAAGLVTVFAKNRRLELGDNILRTL